MVHDVTQMAEMGDKYSITTHKLRFTRRDYEAGSLGVPIERWKQNIQVSGFRVQASGFRE